MNEKNRFDLEQEIMDCWHVVDDLKTLSEQWENVREDEKLNIISGLSSLYQLKFVTLFNTFEQCIKLKVFKE